MRRSTRITIIGAVGLAAALTVVIAVSSVVTHLPDNTAFDPDSDCNRLREHRLDQDGTRLIWRNDEPADLNAIGFDAPNGIDAEPITAHQEGRG